MSEQKSSSPSWVFGPLIAALERMKFGQMTLIFPDGQRRVFSGAQAGKSAELSIHSPLLMFRMLTNGTLGLAESYMAGEWTTPDLVSVIEVGEMNREALGGLDQGRFYMRALQWMVHALRANTRRGAKKNIASHYDLGNDFYKLWLDPSMTYSSAIFDAPDQSLEEAQQAKYDSILSKIKPTDQSHILEIGSGWGGFAIRAAETTGCRVTSLTLSEAQLEEATARVAARGLSDRVTFKLQDYRDAEGQYDGIASIEMFEAVGEEYWPDFFKAIHDRLKPSAVAAIQVITIRDDLFDAYRKGVDFIQRYIFPGGMLPSPSVFRRNAHEKGLQTLTETYHGIDYARTLNRWDQQFVANLDMIRNMGFDERFIRMWRFYLGYCEGGFRRETINLMQTALQRA